MRSEFPVWCGVRAFGLRHSRATLAVVAMMAIALPVPRAQAQESFVFQDAGQPRTFELALDELALSSPHAKRVITKTAAAATRAELQQSAARVARDTGKGAELVVYEVVDGVRRPGPRVVTTQVLFSVQPGLDAQALALGDGAISVRASGAEGYWLATAGSSAAAIDLALALRAQAGVLSAEPQLARQQTRKFAPNDTYFPKQWHLLNTGQSNGTVGMDIRVTNVWNNYRGSNMVIAIIDDGLQTAHPDLSANADTVNDYDINYDDGDPSPDITGDDHGTACAGVAAARGNNSLGVSGSAPAARLVGLRLISAATSDSEEELAINWSNSIIHLKSNSWGPNDDGVTLEGPGTLTAAALSNACMTGRGGRGVIILWAGGNGLDVDDNSNYDGYANSIHTIAIGAMDIRGEQSWYSESGANLVVCAPSSGDNFSANDIGIWTVDRTGADGYNDGSTSGEPTDANYTATFGGTSSATPLATGVSALILEANPLLGWRDMQEILIRSATRNDPTDSDWRANAAGIWFNHKYGGGLISASGAVAMAQTWTNLGTQTSFTTNQTGLSVAIPDNNSAGITRTFTIGGNVRVEHVVATLGITHASRGHLRIELVSPGNTTSVLADVHADTGNNYSGWKFMSVRNWGESSVGTWTLRVSDRTSGTSGTLTDAGLSIFGVAGAPVSNQPPTLVAIGSKSVVQSNLLTFAVTAYDAVDGDQVRLGALDLPFGAVFNTVTNAGGVTNTFTWTSPDPLGVYTTRFYAADKDGTNSEPVVITVGDGSCVSSNVIDEGFDGSTSVPGTWTDGGTANDTASTHYQSAPNCRAFGIGDTLVTPAVDYPTQIVFFVEASSGGNGQNATLEYAIGAGSYVSLPTFTVSDSGSTVTYALNSSPDLSAATAVKFRFGSSFNTWYLDDVRIAGGCAGAPTEPAPSLVVTTAPQTVANAVTSIGVGGTASTGVIGQISWSNNLTGAAGTIAAATSWQIGSVALNVGANVIAVRGTNSAGAAASASVTITRASSGGGGGDCAFGRGGLAIIGYQSDTPDRIAFVALSDIPSGTSIRFTDSGWQASGSFRINEGGIEYTAPSNLPPGAVVAFTAPPASPWAANNTGFSASLALATDGDQILAFTNTVAAPGFIYACTANAAGFTDATDANTTALPTGLTNGVTAVSIGDVDNGYYNGPLSGSAEELRVHISTATNWLTSGSVQTWPSWNFTVTGCDGGGEDTTPSMVITTAPQTVAFATSTIAVGGTSSNLAGEIRWTNSLSGGAGSIAAAADWLVGSVALNVGANAITISGSNSLGVVTSATVSITRDDNDTDDDGLDDTWEGEYFGSLTNMNDTSDWDKDGFPDKHEFLAGSNPTNDQSLLKATSTSPSAVTNGLLVQWQSESNKEYILQRSHDLLAGFVGIASNIPASYPLNTWTDAAPTNAASYRIQLQLP